MSNPPPPAIAETAADNDWTLGLDPDAIRPDAWILRRGDDQAWFCRDSANRISGVRLGDHTWPETAKLPMLLAYLGDRREVGDQRGAAELAARVEAQRARDAATIAEALDALHRYDTTGALSAMLADAREDIRAGVLPLAG